MMPAPTRRHILCKDMADALAPFVAQGDSFNVWRSDRPTYALISTFEAYKADIGVLLLDDFRPGGCLRGTAEFFHQKEACAEAFNEAYLAAVNDEGGEAAPTLRVKFFASVHEVIAHATIDARIAGYFSKLRAGIAGVAFDAIPSVSVDLGVKVSLSITAHIDDLERATRLEHSPDAFAIARTDRFFRELHRACEKRRDAPLGAERPLY